MNYSGHVLYFCAHVGALNEGPKVYELWINNTFAAIQKNHKPNNFKMNHWLDVLHFCFILKNWYICDFIFIMSSPCTDQQGADWEPGGETFEPQTAPEPRGSCRQARAHLRREDRSGELHWGPAGILYYLGVYALTTLGAIKVCSWPDVCTP